MARGSAPGENHVRQASRALHSAQAGPSALSDLVRLVQILTRLLTREVLRREWKKIVRDLDRRIYDKASYGKCQSFGRIDATVLPLNEAPPMLRVWK